MYNVESSLFIKANVTSQNKNGFPSAFSFHFIFKNKIFQQNRVKKNILNSVFYCVHII